MSKTKNTMRAATNTAYGAPDVLRVTEIERPSIGPNEVLVEVRASAVTQGDRRLRAADFPGISKWLGRLLVGLRGPRHPVGGSSFAGRVVEVGAEVTRLRVGEDVYGSVMHGAYAEYLAVKEDAAIARMPESTDYAEAAALPYGGGTAIAFLRDMAKVRPGERVLVVGASGGVGRLAVQVAKHLGAHVTGVCTRGQDRVRALGADAIIDYRVEDFSARDERWDVILDTTEGDHFRRHRRVLGRTGRYLSLYLTLRILFEMLITSFGRGPRAMVGVAMGGPERLDDLREMVDAGAVREPLGERFSLGRIADAHAALEARRPFGTVVVDVAEVEARRLERVA